MPEETRLRFPVGSEHVPSLPGLVSTDFAILLAPTAWSDLGQVDAASYELIAHELKELAVRQAGGAATRAEIRIGNFLVAYDVDPATRRLVVQSVQRAP